MEALTLGINLTISFLEDNNAGNFVPSAAAHNATVKPFFCVRHNAICMVLSPQTLWLLMLNQTW